MTNGPKWPVRSGELRPPPKRTIHVSGDEWIAINFQCSLNEHALVKLIDRSEFEDTFELLLEATQLETSGRSTPAAVCSRLRSLQSVIAKIQDIWKILSNFRPLSSNLRFGGFFIAQMIAPTFSERCGMFLTIFVYNIIFETRAESCPCALRCGCRALGGATCREGSWQRSIQREVGPTSAFE